MTKEQEIKSVDDYLNSLPRLTIDDQIIFERTICLWENYQCLKCFVHLTPCGDYMECDNCNIIWE